MKRAGTICGRSELRPSLAPPREGRNSLRPFCQSLAIAALVCQTLANTACTSYRAAMAALGATSRAAIETTPGFETLPEICE